MVFQKLDRRTSFLWLLAVWASSTALKHIVVRLPPHVHIPMCVANATSSRIHFRSPCRSSPSLWLRWTEALGHYRSCFTPRRYQRRAWSWGQV